VADQPSKASGDLFEIVQGEVYADQDNKGVVKDEKIVSSLLSSIAPSVPYKSNSLCIVSPLLGGGGYNYVVDVVKKPKIEVRANLIKEDVMGAAVLNHRVVCLIPNNRISEPPEVILEYDDSKFGLGNIKK